MIFSPVGCLILILFIMALPVLLALGYFHVITLGFEKLGLDPSLTIIIFLSMLVGSLFNIPVGRKKIVYTQTPSFLGLFKRPQARATGLVINVGGAVIPTIISIYFLLRIPLAPTLIATGLMIAVCKYLSRVVPGKGIIIPALIPPLFAVFFAFFLAPGFTAPCAFVSGVLGTLIGGDLLNLRKAMKQAAGLVSIGGAGVFDGIFLVGIISALFS